MTGERNYTMSKFNSYARKIDELAQKAFEEYETAADTLKKAEAKSREYPQRSAGMSAEYNAKAARAQADYLEAQEKLRHTKRNMDGYNNTVAAIRKELAAAVEAAFVVDPSQVDNAALELMKSGICGAADFERLLADAHKVDNQTMIRLIASYASKAADALREKNGSIPYDLKETWARIHAVGEQGAAHTSRDKLAEFDTLADAFKRTMRNPAMIGSWDALTAGIVEAF